MTLPWRYGERSDTRRRTSLTSRAFGSVQGNKNYNGGHHDGGEFDGTKDQSGNGETGSGFMFASAGLEVADRAEHQGWNEQARQGAEQCDDRAHVGAFDRVDQFGSSKAETSEWHRPLALTSMIT